MPGSLMIHGTTGSVLPLGAVRSVNKFKDSVNENIEQVLSLRRYRREKNYLRAFSIKYGESQGKRNDN
jgi:hypothetical protein